LVQKLCPIVLLLILFSFCDTGKKTIIQLFPGPGFEKGWSWKDMPELGETEYLNNYLGEEAELYKAHGFKKMGTTTYFWGHVKDTSFVVDIYDMETAQNSFNIFSHWRQSDSVIIEIGDEGIVTDTEIRFYSKHFVIRLTANVSSAKTRTAMEVIARQIPDRIVNYYYNGK